MKVFLLFLITTIAFSAFDSKNCEKKLKKDHTTNLIVYFNELIKEQVIGLAEIRTFSDGLKKDELKNPIPETGAKLGTAKAIHREAIEEYFEQTSLDKKRLSDWVFKYLKEKTDSLEKREETKNSTQSVYQKMEFYPIEHGKFVMGIGLTKVNVVLTHDIEAMSTPVTQKQWVEMMGENPSRFAIGKNTVSWFMNGKEVKLQPDNPVENITWWSIVVFINRLSVKMGYPETYDFSEIEWKSGTRAENGTLELKAGKLKINAPKQNIYLAKGYRLPTEAEQEYLLRAAGKATGSYYFGDNEKDLPLYAWFRGNSNHSTQPVAQLNPLIINKNSFYDVLGNVYEFGNDTYFDHQYPFKGGENPVGPRSGYNRAFRGGSWRSDEFGNTSSYRGGVMPNLQNDMAGFRVFRTVY